MESASLPARAAGYLREVRGEIRKVSWPPAAEIRKWTRIIIAFVVVVGIGIGIVDWLFSRILIDFLGGAFN